MSADSPFAGAHRSRYIKGYLPSSGRMAHSNTHAALWAGAGEGDAWDGDRAFELFQMINPLTHARRKRGRDLQVEPYVVAADVYTAAGHLFVGLDLVTGQSAWMYRVAVNDPRLQETVDTLTIDPRIPAPGHLQDRVPPLELACTQSKCAMPELGGKKRLNCLLTDQ